MKKGCHNKKIHINKCNVLLSQQDVYVIICPFSVAFATLNSPQFPTGGAQWCESFMVFSVL